MATKGAEALIPMVQPEDVSERVLRTLQAATESNYEDPNILRVLAHQPDLMRHLLDFSKTCLYDEEIEHRLIELIRIKLAQLNACHF